MADHDDREWLTARERGEDVSHVPAARRAPYDELGALLAELPGMAPTAGWQERVLAEIDRAEQAARPTAPTAPAALPPRRRWRWAAAAAVTAAAAGAALYLTRPPERPSAQPQPGAPPVVTAEIRRGSAAVMGDGERARLGDTLVIHAEAAGPAALRVYGDTGELLAACGDGRACAVERVGERRRLTLEVLLRARGQVQAVVFHGAPLPASKGSLDADLEAAHAAGALATPGPVRTVD